MAEIGEIGDLSVEELNAKYESPSFNGERPKKHPSQPESMSKAPSNEKEQPEGPSQVELLLDQRREDYEGRETHGRRKILTDLKELVVANFDDVNPASGKKIDDETKAELLALGDLRKTVVDMLANEDVGERAQLVKEYIIAKANDDSNAGGKNMGTFRAFMDVIPQQFKSEEEMALFKMPQAEPIEAKPEAESSPQELMTEADMLTDPDAITSKIAAEALDTLKSKSEIALDDVDNFIKTIEKGLPKDDELQAAVEAAQKFRNEHKNEMSNGRKIAVTFSKGLISSVGFQRRFFGKHSIKGKKVIFNPSTGMNDPKSLDRQAWVAFQNGERKASLELAGSAIDKLKKKQYITAEEKLAIFQQIEQYARDIEGGRGSESSKQEKLTVLEKMSDVVKAASPSTGDLASAA